ncbi:MAG: acyl-CoA synthetase [Saprospiraceae bacterium]|nr:acyl-CoA synthetase [Saprospiraceae bacterium]
MAIQLIEQAKLHPNRVAIYSDNKAYTYANLLEQSAQIAQFLLSEKSNLAEDRISFMITPSFQYVAVQWGIWRAGGIAVPLCTQHPLPSLRYVLENTRSSQLIVDQTYQELLAPLAEELEIKLIVLEDLLKQKHPNNNTELPNIDPAQRAMILYTSGTTSLPKGVVTTHNIISSQIQTLVHAWHWKKEDAILNILPLHHVHGIINILSSALWVGASCHFLPKFNAKQVWEYFASGRLNLFMAVPTIYYKLINYWEQVHNTEQEYLSKACQQFRLMVSGSAALPVPVLEQWEAITGQRLLERYGMTEIGMAVSNPYLKERRAGHIGQPLPNVELRLVSEDGKVVEEDGKSGEIQIKGPNVFLEYWEKPEVTQSSFTEDAWFKTGDIAYANEGYYKIMGRNSVDIIKSGGYKISALEIEDVLRRHQQIKDCAVVGIPNIEWGELIAVSLVLTDPLQKTLDFDALKAWLLTQIPAYKLPRKYIIQEDLPRNTIGKVTKPKLKELLATI